MRQRPKYTRAKHLNKSLLLTTFPARHYVLALLPFRTIFQPPVSRFEARSLTHLVKAEIVSPYFGIPINTCLVIQPGRSHNPLVIGEV